MKKPGKKTLKNKMDKLYSEIIRSGGDCEVCGKPARDAHHFIGRKNLNLRWDLRNGVRLCFQHHTGGNQSAHNDPVWFVDWFKKHRPDDYEYLIKKKNEVRTFYLSDYEEIYKELKEVKNRIT
jgi:hypothetical protein